MILAAVSLFSCRGKGDTAVVPDTVEAETVDTLPRASVTFILGKDQNVYNRYYEMASHYYRLSPDERTEAVVDGLTSLSQVLDWLRQHPDTLYHRPYGLVNLVTHGNEFFDLQMTVTPRGVRTSAAALRQALEDSLLAPPDSSVVDARTVVFLHGCAVGQNQALLDALVQAFGGSANVMASRLFEYYAYLSPNHNPQSLRHYYARTWYVFHHPDTAFREADALAQLAARYPDDSADWAAGLHRRFQNNPSQMYHYSFSVPCSYEEVYGVGEPIRPVNSRLRRQEWIDSHADFRALLDSTRIPMKYFQIKFYRQTYLLEDETVVYGLKVKARASVVCLIQPMVHPDSLDGPYAPCRPAMDDNLLFAFGRH